jgi:kinesin family protein 18/19
MIVAVRVRPLNSREVLKEDIDIISVQDKLEIEYADKGGKNPDVLHRSKELRYFFDRIFSKQASTF